MLTVAVTISPNVSLCEIVVRLDQHIQDLHAFNRQQVVDHWRGMHSEETHHARNSVVVVVVVVLGVQKMNELFGVEQPQSDEVLILDVELRMVIGWSIPIIRVLRNLVQLERDNDAAFHELLGQLPRLLFQKERLDPVGANGPAGFVGQLIGWPDCLVGPVDPAGPTGSVGPDADGPVGPVGVVVPMAWLAKWSGQTGGHRWSGWPARHGWPSWLGPVGSIPLSLIGLVVAWLAQLARLAGLVRLDITRLQQVTKGRHTNTFAERTGQPRKSNRLLCGLLFVCVCLCLCVCLSVCLFCLVVCSFVFVCLFAWFANAQSCVLFSDTP